MAELDYAYLADFAAVQDGKLSAIGASFTHMFAPALPGVTALSVAGRIRANEDEVEVPLRILIQPPDGSYELDVSAAVSAGPGTRPYNGKVGILFSFNAQIALPVEGLYQVFVTVNEQVARRLAFSLEVSGS